MKKEEYKKLCITLEKTNPFTEKEDSLYTLTDKKFIRNLQVFQNMNKEEAIKFYNEYKKGISKKQIKELQEHKEPENEYGMDSEEYNHLFGAG